MVAAVLKQQRQNVLSNLQHTVPTCTSGCEHYKLRGDGSRLPPHSVCLPHEHTCFGSCTGFSSVFPFLLMSTSLLTNGQRSATCIPMHFQTIAGRCRVRQRAKWQAVVVR